MTAAAPPHSHIITMPMAPKSPVLHDVASCCRTLEGCTNITVLKYPYFGKLTSLNLQDYLTAFFNINIKHKSLTQILKVNIKCKLQMLILKVIKSYPQLTAFNYKYLRIFLFPYFTKLLNSETFA